MTNQQHPITPPEDLLQQLRRNTYPWLEQITIAYQAGADQELEACVEWLAYEGHEHEHLALRAARRPKPPSLKEQALLALAHLDKGAQPQMDTTEASDTIRRALEALPND